MGREKDRREGIEKTAKMTRARGRGRDRDKNRYTEYNGEKQREKETKRKSDTTEADREEVKKTQRQPRNNPNSASERKIWQHQ